MLVLNVKETLEFEEYTMSSLGITLIELMEKAGRLLVKDFIKRAKPKIQSTISIFAGIGNNGGDALVMAIELRKLGYKAIVYIIGDIPKASQPFMFYYDLVGKIVSINNFSELELNQENIIGSDFIIDGVLGFGISKNVTGYRSVLFDYINESDTIVYSIDIPSGLNPNNGVVLGKAVKANFTGVLGYYILGNLMEDALDYHGEIKLLDLGIMQKYSLNRNYIDIDNYDIELPKRLHNSNKYTFGLGLFFGGRKSMMGSIQMSAYSGLKAGLGVCAVFSDLKDNNFTQFYPEVIVQHNSGDEVMQFLDRAAVVVFGPGMVKNNENHQKVLDYLLKKDIPLVIDASGFDYLDITKTYINKNIILTPHVGEISRMFGVTSSDVHNDPLKYIDRLTDKGFNVILKGPSTIIASKDRIRFLQAKNPGLATAGSGDSLSGILAAFLASNDVFEAMILGVVTHSKAGKIAKDEFGETSLVASNIIDSIYKVFK